MENRAVTFPQTQTILNDVNVPNVHNSLLLEYYNRGNSEELKKFLYENAIQGIIM